MTSPSQADLIAGNDTSDGEPDPPKKGKSASSTELAGRSPGQLMWTRFKRDRTGVVAGCVVIFFFVIAALAPVISKLYGKNPYTLYGQDDFELLDEYGYPTGNAGGISGDFWFGLEPNLGRDIFTQLLYGMRTSLYTALVVAVLAALTGVIIGVTAGYLGGKVDFWLSRFTDFVMAFPSQLFLIAMMPVVTAIFVDPQKETPVHVRFFAVVAILWFLGWMGMARLVRSQTLSLREREYVDAARVSGASSARILRKELLPNLQSTILIQASYMLPSAILTIAFASFVGAGFQEPTPDWGRMFAIAGRIYEENPTYMLFPGVAMVIFILAFNLFGDSVRDAIDPKAGR